MGLFKKEPEPVPVHTTKTTRTSHDSGHGHGFFSRGSRNSSVSSPTSTTSSSKRHSVGPTTTTTTTTHKTGGGLLSRLGGSTDPSITAASQRVLQAEKAEREADAALVQARIAVKDAREQVARLEREAAEEARLAKIKQEQAADISKRAAPLGRHG